MPDTNDGEHRTQERRAPSGDARQRDAERSRQLLLDAALDEFAAKGFAGARVHDIAARAGVNKQLITYYFGGKEGLYQALNQLWLEQEASFATPNLPLDTLMAEYLHASLEDPRLARLLIWAGLTGQLDASEADEHEATAREDVADLQRRQAAGEIAPDLDPGLVLLALMGLGIAPIAMPQVVRRITGLDIQSPEFETAYAEQLKRIIRLLRGREAD
jgi:TetR/AcrR family transcriptional regulator